MNQIQPIGKKRWAIAEGYIPESSHGPGPEMTSHEALCFLNAGPRPARVQLWAFFTDREPLGPFVWTVEARRSRHVRLNDLEDPGTIPKGVEYSCLIEASEPVVVQHTRLDSRHPNIALMSTVGYCEA